MPNDYDADDFPEERDGVGLRSLTISGLVLLVVGGFLAFAWYAYRSNSNAGGEATEVIHADAGPVKEKPKNPGGMAIPYQDMSVYNVISGKKDAKVEKLLPDPEEPMAHAAAPAAPVVAEQKAPVASPAHDADSNETKMWIKGESDSAPAPGKERLTPPSQVPASPATATVPAPSSKERLAAVPPAKAEPAATPAAKSVSPDYLAQALGESPGKPSAAGASAKPGPHRFMDHAGEPPAKQTIAAPAAPAAGNVQVQLAALKKPSDAAATWNSLKARYPADFAGKTSSVVKAELPSGTFYRLRVGGFSTQAAKKLCSELVVGRHPCMVVH